MNSVIGGHVPSQTPGAKVQVFRTPNVTGATDFAVWSKPRGVSMISILCVGAGAGAGTPNYVSTTNGSGSGGAGSGGIGSLLIQSWLVPDILYIHTGRGGAGALPRSGTSFVAGSPGGQSYVSTIPCLATLAEEIFIISSSNEATGGPSIGNPGVGATVATAANAILSLMGIATWRAGVGGASSNAGAAGDSTTMSASLPLTGGAAGGGVTGGTTSFAGGNITGAGTFPTVSGGQPAALDVRGGAGNGGVFNRMYGLMYAPSNQSAARGCGGSGAAGTVLTVNVPITGAAGGNGSTGCGGGGAGAISGVGGTTAMITAGVFSGAGGSGGNGMVIIAAW